MLAGLFDQRQLGQIQQLCARGVVAYAASLAQFMLFLLCTKSVTRNPLQSKQEKKKRKKRAMKEKKKSGNRLAGLLLPPHTLHRASGHGAPGDTSPRKSRARHILRIAPAGQGDTGGTDRPAAAFFRSDSDHKKINNWPRSSAATLLRFPISSLLQSFPELFSISPHILAAGALLALIHTVLFPSSDKEQMFMQQRRRPWGEEGEPTTFRNRLRLLPFTAGYRPPARRARDRAAAAGDSLLAHQRFLSSTVPLAPADTG